MRYTKPILLSVIFLFAMRATADDCQVTYKGTGYSGYAKHEEVKVTKWFKDAELDQCIVKAKRTITHGRVTYTRERVKTSKGRYSPISKSHYMSIRSATVCLGEIGFLRLSFDLDEESCKTIFN